MSPVASTRWCPTAEQIMILEEMYRGGIRTPNATQIQQITAHLSLYGKIEGKNVFYWFQNHKARDRQKLRKRLLGKQLHLHQPQQQREQQQQQQKPIILPNITTSINTEHNIFQQQPSYHNFRHNHLHFDEITPPLPRYPSSYSPLIGFHQLHNLNSPPCFSANHQGRTHSHAWKMETTETNNGIREKSRQTNNWMMIGDHHDDNHHDDHYHEMGDDDDDDDDTSPLKTLQLFPIKEKTSLKEQHHNNNNNNLSPPTQFHAYF